MKQAELGAESRVAQGGDGVMTATLLWKKIEKRLAADGAKNTLQDQQMNEKKIGIEREEKRLIGRCIVRLSHILNYLIENHKDYATLLTAGLDILHIPTELIAFCKQDPRTEGNVKSMQRAYKKYHTFISKNGLGYEKFCDALREKGFPVVSQHKSILISLPTQTTDGGEKNQHGYSHLLFTRFFRKLILSILQRKK